MNILVLLSFWGCIPTADAPRAKYNVGTTALNEARYEEASTTLLEARDEASTDAQLRQHSAYNLALSYARQGMSAEESEPEEALEHYQQATSWFRDAVRLNPDDAEARINLEVVLKRIQLLADKLNAGKNSLEARLERILEDTRMLRDRVRVLDDAISKGRDVSSLQEDFDQLAIKVRTLQAQASTIIQLSGGERGTIQNKGEEATPEEAMRAAQLTALEAYLERGRDNIADARRVLRRQDVEKSLDRLDKSVRNIHRAREQLQDPLAVLQVLAQEEGQLQQFTSMLQQTKEPQLLMTQEKPPVLPNWFGAKYLSQEQSDVHSRCDEIAQRFAAAAGQEQTEETTEEQKEYIALITDALPPLLAAVGEMKQAQVALEAEQLSTAVQHEYQAQRELASAIERFADAKNLIELAYNTQQSVISLMTPPQENDENALPVELSPEQRLKAIQKGLTENISRMERLEGALKREKQKQLKQIPPPQEGAEEDPQAQVEELFTRAEQLRAQGLSLLKEIDTLLLQEEREETGLVQAKQTEETLQQLRIMFFSVVEHLKLLLEDQGKLRDDTSALVAGDYDEMIASLGLTIAQQEEQAQRAASIAEVLQQQADAAQGQEGQQQQQAEAFAEAYGHVSTAETAMGDAIAVFGEVQNEEGGVSGDPEPGLENQLEAMESLAAAIQALQPPQQNQGDENNDQDQQEQQEEMSQQQSEKRLQAAREREAERAKKRQQAAGTQPVEKDW